MTGRENMAGIMAATGLYKLTGSSPVDWELDAYGKGLGILEADMELLEAELFVMTAPAQRLDQWEKLFRCQASGGSLEDRRLGVAKALSPGPGALSLPALEDILLIAGVRGGISWSEGKLHISVQEYIGVKEAEAKRLLDRLLPAHLEWEITVAG